MERPRVANGGPRISSGACYKSRVTLLLMAFLAITVSSHPTTQRGDKEGSSSISGRIVTVLDKQGESEKEIDESAHINNQYGGYCPSHCVRCYDPYTCIQCEYRYYIYNGQCVYDSQSSGGGISFFWIVILLVCCCCCVFAFIRFREHEDMGHYHDHHRDDHIVEMNLFHETPHGYGHHDPHHGGFFDPVYDDHHHHDHHHHSSHGSRSNHHHSRSPYIEKQNPFNIVVLPQEPLVIISQPISSELNQETTYLSPDRAPKVYPEPATPVNVLQVEMRAETEVIGNSPNIDLSLPPGFIELNSPKENGFKMLKKERPTEVQIFEDHDTEDTNLQPPDPNKLALLSKLDSDGKIATQENSPARNTPRLGKFDTNLGPAYKPVFPINNGLVVNKT